MSGSPKEFQGLMPTDKDKVRCIVTGSRLWNNRGAIQEALGFLWELNGMVTVVHGACPRGADAMASDYVRNMNSGGQGVMMLEEPHPADWKLGKQAGFIRNATMAGLGADICLAFNKNKSRGTSHMIDLCHKMEIPVLEWIA